MVKILKRSSLESYRGRNAVGRTSYSMARCILKSKGHGKLSIHFTADYPTIETVCRTIISVNQLSIHGAVTTQLKNLKLIKIDRGNLMFWLENCSWQSKNRSSFTTKIPWMTKLYGNSTFNKIESLSPENRVSRSVRKQDLCVLLKWDRISWPRTLVILDNFVQWLVANTLFPETMQHHNSRKHENWARIRSHDQLPERQTWDWNQNLVCGSRQFWVLGQNIVWNKQVCDRFK